MHCDHSLQDVAKASFLGDTRHYKQIQPSGPIYIDASEANWGVSALSPATLQNTHLALSCLHNGEGSRRLLALHFSDESR